MEFSKDQLERYARHLVLKEIGVKGQMKLLNSKVLVIGTGGLGSPVAMYLAAAGIGTIGLVDPDVVELSNLQRQIIHSSQDLGRPKVISGKETINSLNPDVDVVTYEEWVSSENISDILKDRDYDFIIDATDNLTSKFLINDACVLLKKPFSHAGVSQLFGQTMTYVPGEGPCYRCIFLNPPPATGVQTNEEKGVLGVIPGVIGTIQATEAIKFLLGIGELLTGKLLVFDALDMEFRKVEIAARTNCIACG
ncbi:HesA/MoeB/ThiF family protein [Desulfosporosinus fructosivorans]|uniref:HesA/MoeB/ThiF family protein n=1 Tax=Desulfosporosinus fructosivorans TaxID=2018669 RepID=A0A4Z0R6L8_9FIRM|nr:HesA/MoeB/ThiF family protein [Desulfosporosinus fructosivorans]TGE38781.1 HesA/MoeB/ThiF family protein [Desulfosporosinus fructosivorans]